jgi:hypothetical protein
MINKICEYCNNPFSIRLYRQHTARFCSRQCNDLFRDKKVKRTCASCNKEFSKKPSKIFGNGKSGNIGKFCCRKCYGNWISKNEQGTNNRNWKGENSISKINQRVRSSFKAKKWRQDIYLRDNFTCQECGKQGSGLEAHHKKLFIILLNEAKEYLPLMELFQAVKLYNPMWDINNGITLCRDCHKKIHGGEEKWNL